jgi:hypothetical protein
MAKKLESFPRGPLYDWDQWLDGSPWLLTRGEDFEIDIPSMRAAASRAAKARGLRVRTSAVEASDGQSALAVQAYPAEQKR